MKICKKCKGKNHPSAYRCRYCNTLFPDGQKIVAQRREKSKALDDKKTVWNAAAVLYIIGGVFSLIGVFFTVFAISRGYGFFFHLPLTTGAVFIGLAIWSKHEEFWSILIGFILYSLVGLLLVIISGFSFFIIIFFLSFEIYLFLGVLKIKRKPKLTTKDILDV
ncbi:MAG: hypothetical protein CMP61_08325 [Flavobacteriales bacterium]|nr:hypothetical protein [Flavobacteriales bacterium]|tara:strand:+ start:4814 stop:5305 length:492 start_codon:yes stop_codon:yes gene_type:complete